MLYNAGFGPGTGAVTRTLSSGTAPGGGKTAAPAAMTANAAAAAAAAEGGFTPPDANSADADMDDEDLREGPRPAPRVPLGHTARFLVLVALWYVCSSLTNNIGKEILERFRFPVTLTVAQFGFIGLFTYIYTTLLWWASDRRGPRPLMPLTRTVVNSVLPLAGFNIIGHIFSAIAISRVPVSFVHTIKAVSPFFTVVLSTVILRSRYSRDVYISLVPLVVGVILACTSELAWEFWGGLAALASALVFVVQNIFSKKVFQDGQLDELNLLFYSSVASFAFLLPVWLYLDGVGLLLRGGAGPASATDLMALFLANGVTHFGQNIFAFTIMTLVSPVTYSIASLFKRVVIIVSALVYFETTVTLVNIVGLVLTFGGLYMYNNARESTGLDAQPHARLSLPTTAPPPPTTPLASAPTAMLALASVGPTSPGSASSPSSASSSGGPPPSYLAAVHASAPASSVPGSATGAPAGGRAKTVHGHAMAAAAHYHAPHPSNSGAVGDSGSFIPRRDSDLMLVYSKV